METTFLVIFTLLFLFYQTYGASISNTIITASSNVTCIQREWQSLLVFKEGLIDESNRLSTWTGVECCEWLGVGCDRRNSHVIKLDLRYPLSFMDDYTLNTSKWLQGKVSPSLLNLKHLRYLDLSMNNFSGQNIPEFFGSFKYLEYLNLSCSGFSGAVPPRLGNLSRLQYLDLNRQYLYDMVLIPIDVSLMVKDDLRWVSLLSSLRYLDLSGITIGNHIDWFHPFNMLPSLLTLNLAWCGIDISSVKFINFTSLISLDLSYNGINSTIPVWLSNLTGLVHLNLKENDFHGQIPVTIGALSSLSYIDLSLNQLSGPIPPSLGGLSYLRVLSLYYNQLSASIPESIGLLTRLQELYLYSNQLNGSIPESIGQLTRLQVLVLDSNQLSGNIPTSLGQLSNLVFLDVSNNLLNGVLSEMHFTKVNNLAILYLSHNSLTLNVSPHWIPPFRLKWFIASSCNIGPKFPSLIKKSTNLEALDLSNSSIRDSIPGWFENISSHIRYLNLSDNHIGPQFPSFIEKSTVLEHLDLSNSNIRDSVPEWFENISSLIQELDLSDNQIDGNLPRIRNPGLNIVHLGKNRFTGSVPTHLCELLSIQILDLSNNNFSGDLPKCLGSLIQLRVIDLSNNTITGGVPKSLDSLSYLQSLHLHNNKLEGNFPVALQNLKSLVTLDLGNNLLTGDIPSWIGKNSPNLKILNLQSNKFMGKIGLELCQNNALQHLNLANNSITGTVPHCFCNLNGMISGDNFGYEDIGYEERIGYEDNIEANIKEIQLKYTRTLTFLTSLDLSGNKFCGEIPDVLMNLVALKNLNLSRNLLSGQVPARIGNLKQMESLDLSMNKLSGQIPQSLASLSFLSYLNLSFNNLIGPIPIGNQLQILGDPSTIYEGNTELCGPLLSRSCKENKLFNEGKDQWFYVGMESGFVVGFLGFLGSLHFIRIWRVTYFEMIENVYDYLMISIIVNLARLRRKTF